MGDGTEGQPDDEQPAPVRSAFVPTEAELRKRFFFRAPRDMGAQQRHSQVSELTFELANKLCELCYPGRNLLILLTLLEDVRMRANASIAVDDPRP